VPVLRSDRYQGQRWVIVGCWLTLLVAWAFMILAEVQEKEIVEIAYQYQMILGPAVYSAAALLWVGARLDRRPLPALGLVALIAGLLLPQTVLDAEIRQQLRQWLDPSQIFPILPSEYWSVALLLTVGGALLALALRSRRVPAIGAAGLVLGVAFAATAIDAAAYLPPERCSYLASQYRVAQRTIVWATDEQIDTRAVAWYDPEERRTRTSGCPAMEMQPIFNAIRQGTTIPPAALTMPHHLDDVNPDLVRVAVRNRLSVSLLSTPETADQAAAALQEWAGRAPNPATVRPRKRFEAVDGDVAVVFQVFELRRP
jgi:hypothetical protein